MGLVNEVVMNPQFDVVDNATRAGKKKSTFVRASTHLNLTYLFLRKKKKNLTYL